ncbi:MULTISPECIES: OmpA family protein [Persicobacter]|uniref:OmpA-like domain-containing protein n=1 Tax=Persicobacter diffluens TaxID=981 RepID=A0AAN5AL27_9BACT|nr:OmpA family protein [Persicobacter sp. CCB-QB2]GJM62427.1 hypothetical protein PEDI_29790 [Persicobacter diffluens]
MNYAYSKAFFSILLGLLLFPNFSNAQNIWIVKGKVADNDTGKPVKTQLHYQTLPHGNQIGIISMNPETGSFTFKAMEGEYEITATAEGYIKNTQIVSIKEVGEHEQFFVEFKLRKEGSNEVLRLSNLTFDQNKAEIKPESFEELNELAAMVRDNPSMIIQLEGHTDFRGSQKGNLKLSEERVKAVRDYLVNKSVDNKRIKIKAFGGTKPLTRESSEDARAQNRRVEVRILEF